VVVVYQVGYYVTRECASCGILCAGDGPIAALVGGSGSSKAVHYNTVHLMTTKIITLQYRLLTNTKEGKYDGAVQ